MLESSKDIYRRCLMARIDFEMEMFGKTYINLEDDSFYKELSNYNPLLESFGKIVVKVDEDNCQGSSWVFYKDDGRYGYLSFNWGSCSGCDRLMGCYSFDDFDELVQDLRDSIIWFNDKEEALMFLDNHDWEGDPCEDRIYLTDFIKKCKEFLNSEDLT